MNPHPREPCGAADRVPCNKGICPDEPLSQRNEENRRDEKRLDSLSINRVMAPEASFVWTGAEEPMTGQGRLNGDGSRLGIADFTDHDNIRILPRMERRPLAKVIPALRLS